MRIWSRSMLVGCHGSNNMQRKSETVDSEKEVDL